MVNYWLDKRHSFFYYHYRGNIGIGANSKCDLTDDEWIEYTSDALTHEHIHKVLDELFNTTTCLLFDTIEYMFRNSELLEKHVASTNNRMTHQAYIKQYGLIMFLSKISIDKTDIKQANIVCGAKCQTDKMSTKV